MSEQLAELWPEVINCKLCVPGSLNLKHMLGVGQQFEPEIMLVLMNPTGRNLTLQPGYDGSPLPYGGIKSFWKVLVEAGLLPGKVLANLDARPWTDTLTSQVTDALLESNLYITELVKCPSPLAVDPTPAQVANGLDILKREIDIVKPKRIVTFGLLVFQALTRQKIKLAEYLSGLEEGKPAGYFVDSAQGQPYEVFPCYFPTGRGNGRAATRVLRLLAVANGRADADAGRAEGR